MIYCMFEELIHLLLIPSVVLSRVLLSYSNSVSLVNLDLHAFLFVEEISNLIISYQFDRHHSHSHLSLKISSEHLQKESMLTMELTMKNQKMNNEQMII